MKQVFTPKKVIKKKRHILACSILILAGISTTLVVMSNVALADNHSLTVAQSRDPQNLDPIDTFRLAWGSIASNIFDGLLYRTEALELQPGLATSWEFLDNDSRIRFNLRKNVTFHNGESFNAEAVKYTFDRLLGEEGAGGPQRGNYTSIDSIEIVDKHTVDFVMKRPDPVLITKLAGYGAMIVPPKYIQEVGEKAFDMHPIGTGPFKVVKYTPAVDIKMERFDDYWNGQAMVEDLTIRFIPEQATRVAELLSGGVDIALNIPTTSVETIQNNASVDLVAVEGPTVEILRFKTKDAVTADPRVRKAIIMAIDRETIIQALLKGLASPITSAQGSKSFGFNSDIKAYPYDPEAAKSLLKEAGVKPGTKVILDLRNDRDNLREIAQVVASFLKAVGLELQIRTHETSVFFDEIVSKGKSGEMFHFGWGGWTFDFDNTAYLLYHTGERNNPYIDDEKLNSLLDKERQTYDVEVRRKALQDVAAYAHDNALDIPLYNLATLYGVNKKVKGFIPAPDDRARYMTVSVK